MQDVFSLLLVVALAAIVGVLVMGVLSMARGGQFNARNSNRLMRWRIGLQMLAVALILLYFLFGRG